MTETTPTAAAEFETVTEIFEIPVENLPRLEKKLAKLAKRAKRTGSAAVGFEKMGAPTVRKSYRVDAEFNTYEANVLVQNVRVWGPRPMFNGWTFVGRLDFKSAAPGVVRAMVPGEDCPESAKDAAPGRCDHCDKSRRRNDSFVVRHEDGTVKVVGRSCLADFLGHMSPEELATLATLACDAREAGEEAGKYSGAAEVWGAVEILTVAAMSVRTIGWQSKKGSAVDRVPTAFIVRDLLSPHLNDSHKEAERLEALKEINDADRAKGAEALTWILNQTATTDYIYNLRTIAENPVTSKGFGILVSGIVAYDRAMEIKVKRAHERKSLAGSVFMGQAKDKVEFVGEVSIVRGLASDWGVTTMIKFITDDGNAATWFASGEKDIARGARVSVRGTVKKLEEYEGVKQTVLTRCTVTVLEV